MTKLLLTALVVFTAVNASAALKLTGRFDLNNTGFDDKARAAGGMPSWALTPQKTDLAMTGNVDEHVTYEVVAKLASSLATKGTRSGQNTGVAAANVTNTLSENLSVTIGKYFSNIGGWESQPSSADMYIYSQYSNFEYDYSGLKLTGTFGDHAVEVHFAHPEDQGSGTNVTFTAPSTVTVSTANPYYDRTGAIGGIVYMGSFGEKAFNLMASYHMGKVAPKGTIAGLDKDITESFTSLGFKYDADPVVVSLDYNMYANENAAGATTNGNYTAADGQKNTLTSIVLGAGMKLGNLMPKLQASTETFDAKPASPGTEVKTAYTNLGLALEYTPNTDSKFRYHVAYTSSTSKADTTGADALTETHFIIGTKFSADVLK